MTYVTVATEDDITRILEIEQEAISPPWTHGALLGEIYREDSLFAVAKGLRDRRTALLTHPAPMQNGTNEEADPGILCKENHPPDTLGFVILRRAADEGELFQIAVDKTARQRGVADMLITSALNYASESGLTSIHLEVRKSNEAAIALYKKHGFKLVRYRKNYFDKPVEDAMVMVWEY